MKAIKIALVMILLLNVIYSLSNWLSTENDQSYQSQSGSYAEPQAPEVAAAEGLSLLGLTALVKEVRSGQELERRLNEANSINNMDLDGNEKVDYLYVKEFGDAAQKIGYSLTAEPVKGETQEIAEITIEKNGDRAEIQVIGSEQIYGTSAIYNDWVKVEREVAATTQSSGSNMPRHSSYFFPHPLWISPWYFGFYPAFYRPYPIMASPMYASRMGNYNTSSVKKGRNGFQSTSGKKIANPNKGKIANKGITRSLRKPTSTQKQFQATQKKNIRSGGFGQTSRSTGSSVSKRGASSSFGTSSKTNVNRFGSTNKNSLFGSRRSSGGSVRSSSFGSRSFSFGK